MRVTGTSNLLYVPVQSGANSFSRANSCGTGRVLFSSFLFWQHRKDFGSGLRFLNQEKNNIDFQACLNSMTRIKTTKKCKTHRLICPVILLQNQLSELNIYRFLVLYFLPHRYLYWSADLKMLRSPQKTVCAEEDRFKSSVH